MLGDQGKPAFDLIEPGRVSRRVVNLVSGSLRQPCAHLLVFVSSVIVDDQMNVEFGGDALVQAAQEREKLLMPVSRLAFREDRSGGDIQCSE